MAPSRALQFPIAVDEARVREPLDRALTYWRDRYELTDAEVSILRLAALGTPRGALAEARRVAPSTIKKQVKLMLDKTGDAKLDDAANRLLRVALAISCRP